MLVNNPSIRTRLLNLLGHLSHVLRKMGDCLGNVRARRAYSTIRRLTQAESSRYGLIRPQHPVSNPALVDSVRF